MHKYFLALSFIALLSGCATKDINPETNAKVFPQEDFYILTALDAKTHHHYKKAAATFLVLYEKSHKKEYLNASLETMLQARDYKQILEIVPADTKDTELLRFRIYALLGLEKYEKANKLALTLENKEPKEKNYELIAQTFFNLKEYKQGALFFDKAYKINYDDAVVQKLAFLYYNYLDEKQKAIELLKTHIQINGCAKLVCRELLIFYSQKRDLDGILNIYKKLYKVEPTKELATKIIQVYLMQKKFIELQEFLEKTQSDNLTLLNLYVTTKNYTKASKLAYKLYLEKGDYTFLGKSAVYMYEATKKKKISKKVLDEVIARLEVVIQKEKSSLFLNYLGYLLIDHDLNVTKGIAYVKEALKQDPNSVFYLDSLAWGEYKLGNCKEAQKIMKKVLELDTTSNNEIKIHKDAIFGCLITKKGKK